MHAVPSPTLSHRAQPTPAQPLARSTPWARLGALFAVVAATTAAPMVTLAADDAPPSRPAAAAQPLAAARAQIAAKQWPAALAELKKLNARGDADWNNLMGYVLRKQATPDLAGAETHYNEALRLNPSHRGALEYSGELYLMKGDTARAEERLATLTKVCNGCEEQKDLQEALDRYKKAGNRHVPN